jgi:hypothetical protein
MHIPSSSIQIPNKQSSLLAKNSLSHQSIPKPGSPGFKNSTQQYDRNDSPNMPLNSVQNQAVKSRNSGIGASMSTGNANKDVAEK